MSTPSRILVVGPSWVGDMVMAQSLFKALAEKHPGVAIDVLAPGWSLPLLERMPEVSQAIDMPLGHGQFGLKQRWRLGKSLARRNYDQAILLPNSWKSALTPFAAGIPIRTGWVGEMRYGLLNDIRRLDKSRLTMTVQRFVALAEPADVKEVPSIQAPELTVRPEDVELALNALHLERDGSRLLVLCPGAEYGAAKRWPESRYGELAAEMMDLGWSVWLFGSEKDRAVCRAINDYAGDRCVDLSGVTSLAQAVDLMSLADAVVSNDSGLMHVAAALDRPLVAVYGSSDPGFTPPLNRRHRVISMGLECSPCFKRECPEGHLDCLNGIGVEQVASALLELAEEN